jgi:hypothetical protein
MLMILIKFLMPDEVTSTSSFFFLRDICATSIDIVVYLSWTPWHLGGSGHPVTVVVRNSIGSSWRSMVLLHARWSFRGLCNYSRTTTTKSLVTVWLLITTFDHLSCSNIKCKCVKRQS